METGQKLISVSNDKLYPVNMKFIPSHQDQPQITRGIAGTLLALAPTYGRQEEVYFTVDFYPAFVGCIVYPLQARFWFGDRR